MNQTNLKNLAKNMIKRSSFTPRAWLAAGVIFAAAIITLTAGAKADFVVTAVSISGVAHNVFKAADVIDGVRLTDPTVVETSDPVPAQWPLFQTVGDGTGETTAGYNAWRVPSNTPSEADGTLLFDLGEVYNLSAAYVWNYGEIFSDLYYNARGAKDISFSFSVDGVSFSSPAPFSLTRAPNAVTYEGEALGFGASPVAAQFVKLWALNNYGDGSFTGLGEVRFIAVPEPTTGVAMLGGLGMLGMLRRRNRVA
jgi:hypothetical protein